MANPVPYNQLFDIDGLKAAIKDAENTADQFGSAVTADFQRTQGAAAALRKELEAINATMNGKTIKLTDDAGQAQIQAFAAQVSNLTQQYKNQQAAIDAMNKVLNSNKAAIADAKTAQAQYAAELAKSRVATQDQKTAIANITLQMKQLALANKQATQAQTAATGSYKEAQQRLTALGNAIKNTKDGFTSTSPALQNQIRQYNDLNDKLKAFDAQMGNHQRNVGNYQGALSGLTSQLESYALGMLSIGAAIEAVKKTFDTALETDANRTSLQYILGDVGLADQKIKALKKTANDLGLEFIDLTRAYVLFTGAAKASNFSLNDSDKVFNSVARAAGILHLSSDKTTAALYALQEMISKGVVQSKELQRQLAQAIPGAASIMAQALGVSNEKLREMEKSGELLAQDVLPKFADQLDKTFAPGITQIDSMQAAWNRLKNSFSESVDDNSNIKTFFTSLLEGLAGVSNALLKTVNSSSWKEFFLRISSLADLGSGPSGTGSGLAKTFIADQMHSDNSTTEDEKAIEIFRAANRQKQLEFLQVQTTIRDNAYKQAQKGHKEDIAFYNEQQATLIKLRGIYAEMYTAKQQAKYIDDEDLKTVKEINKRIEELKDDALANPNAKASDISRIEKLKERLKELNPTVTAAKSGLAQLQDQMNKVAILLQDAIIKDYATNQGKETEQTKKLAEAYATLEEKIRGVQAAQKAQIDAALDSYARQQQIKNFGAVYPTSKPNPDNAFKLSKKDSDILNVGDDNMAIGRLENELDNVVNKYNKANKAILEQYKARNITKNEYDAQLLDSEQKQAGEEYYLNVSILIKQLDIAKITYGENSKEYNKLLERKASLDKKYDADWIRREEEKRAKIIAAYNEMFTSLEKNAQEIGNLFGQNTGKLFSDLTNSIKEFSLANALGETVSFSEKVKMASDIAIDSVGAYTDFAINSSKQRQAQLEAEMQYEMDGAGNNAAAKLKIEANYTKKINAEKTKQAKLAKAAAAIDIIINTAVAVSKVIGQTGIFGIGLAPIVAALGAVELGLVLAQPIPQFAKGREDGPATVAEVNERGPEALVKGNRVRFANKGKRGYTYLEKGEKVITADKTSQMINRQLAYQSESADSVSQSRVIYDRYIATTTGNHGFDYDRMGSHVADAVSKLPFEQNIFDERGHARYRRTVNARIKSVRERNQL